LEVLYSTGIRRMEVVHLSVYDLDAERGTLMVRQGKGKKDRMVPIGEQAIAWLERYLSEVRPGVVVPPDAGVLFLTASGEELSPNRLTQLVRDYVNAAQTGKKGACYLFRHTMATLMLECGADIRCIQEMLGHVELSTTQIYTQVSIRKLQAVHALTHPTAKLERRPAAEAQDAGPALVKTTVSADELFAHLALRTTTRRATMRRRRASATLDGAVAPPARRSRSGQQVA
jgi:integrase/recombinase XerD